MQKPTIKNKFGDKDYLLKILDKEMGTLSQKTKLDFAYIIMNELYININDEEHFIKFHSYLKNWKFRNMQINLENFYLSFETTILNFFIKSNDFKNIKISNYLTNDLYKMMLNFSSFKNDPSIVNFISYDKSKLNFNVLKNIISILKSTFSNIVDSYGFDEELYDFQNQILDFFKFYKYEIIYIEKFNFEFKNDLYIAINSNNKIYFEIDELIKLISNIMYICEHLILYIPNRIEKILLIPNISTK